MDILTYIENDGYFFKKKATTHGGEYKGPCPWCGGNDRFTIWPHKDRYICRQCDKRGDLIQYIRDKKGLSYYQACIEAGDEERFKKMFSKKGLDENAKWEPRETIDPPDAWMENLEREAFIAHKYLCSMDGLLYRTWLANRGINSNTIKKARLGWIKENKYFSRKSCGLEKEFDLDTGKEKKIWIPSGLSIPFFKNNKIIRLRIRQSSNQSSNPYIIVTGSNTSYMTFSDIDTNKPSIICESELDGWLLEQESNNSLNIFAIGNAQARPDTETDNILKQTPILLNLDADKAGIKEIEWWRNHYPNSIPWLTTKGKDAGEAFKNEININIWILSGIEKLKQKNKKIKHVKNEWIPEKQTKKPPLDMEIIKFPEPKSVKKCMHLKDCVHLKIITDSNNNKRRVCLMIKNKPNNEKFVFDLDCCPKGIWKKWTKGYVSQIILMPIVKSRFKKRPKK